MKGNCCKSGIAIFAQEISRIYRRQWLLQAEDAEDFSNISEAISESDDEEDEEEAKKDEVKN